MRRAIPIMVQGTHSDAGKSLIATALCRIFAEDGYRTAPFKSQNMSLNSYVTADGLEIGRAQGVQAEAAGVVGTTDMNPILIKPSRDYESQIVVHGKPFRTMKAGEYRSDFFEKGKQIIADAYSRLSESYDRIVIEGAGSPAEINLNDRELVNMRVARMANAPVVLVGDIDKGGVFASLVGTLQLLDPVDRERVAGVIINKFRGDISLLKPGLDWFLDYTGIPVLGVMPYLEDLNIEAEDSLALSKYSRNRSSEKAIDVAVIAVSRISNFTDIDPFTVELDCHVRMVRSLEELGEPDLIIVPGSKNTIEDLTELRNKGLVKAIVKLSHERRTSIFGICGGYQMLGEKIEDPHGVESTIRSAEGMGLLPVRTVLAKEKATIRSKGIIELDRRSISVEGYEIHMGRTTPTTEVELLVKVFREDEIHKDGCRIGDSVIGTYFHGIFHNDEFRAAYLNVIRRRKGLTEQQHEEIVDYRLLRDQGFQRLAAAAREHIDMAALQQIMEQFHKRDTVKS
ncbi:MAG: cobyric acid synthase [Paenibacillaceae bacterium]